MFVLCVVSKDKKAKCRTIKAKTQIRMKYKHSIREYKIIPSWARFSAPVQIGPGAHPASYTISTGVSFLVVKRPGHGVDHPPPFSAEVKEIVELYLDSVSGHL
jgi:hypothetical protein